MGQNETWNEGDGNPSSQKKIPTGNNMSKNLPDLKIQETFQKAKEFRTTQISAVTEAIDKWGITVEHKGAKVSRGVSHSCVKVDLSKTWRSRPWLQKFPSTLNNPPSHLM